MRRKIDHRQETGAVAVVVAICLMGLLGIAALAIDLGSAWSTKRNLVTDTDAAALAGALVLQGDCTNLPAATTEARSIFRANTEDGASIPDSDIVVEPVPGSGVCEALRVAHTGSAQTTFGGTLGRAELDVLSSSTAISEAGGNIGTLRPIVVCRNFPGLSAFLDVAGNVVTPAPSPQVHSVAIDKTWKTTGQVDTCGDSPGNFGWTCFTGNCSNGGGRDDIPAMLQHGARKSVDLGNLVADSDNDCDPLTSAAPHDDCSVKPGSLGQSNDAEINSLVCDDVPTRDCLTFPLLVTDAQTGQGRTAEINPHAFLYVRLLDHCWEEAADGCAGWPPPPASTSNGNTNVFVFEFVAVQRTGRPDGSGISGPPVSRLCANDSTDYTSC